MKTHTNHVLVVEAGKRQRGVRLFIKNEILAFTQGKHYGLY